MNNSFSQSWAKRIRIVVGAAAFIFLASSPTSKVHAQAWKKMTPDGAMVTIGITQDGKYPIYQLKVDSTTMTTGQFPSDGYVFSTEELPMYMVRIQPSDVNKNGYKCNTFCTDKFGNLVGLNPERVKVEIWNTRTIPPIDHEKKYKIYPLDGSDLNDTAYNFRDIRYSPQDIVKAIPPIEKKDVDRNGYKCDFLCVNADGKVVGWNPLDKRVEMYGKN